jgi:O-antigen/teichoic acid export membrane protein
MINNIKEKFLHPGFQRYFKNTGWMFSGKIVNLVVAFVVNVMIARYLGPDRYGVLSYVISFVGLFLFIPGFGVGGIILRDLVKFPEKKNAILGTTFFLNLFGAILAIIIIVLIVVFNFNHDPFTNILIIIMSSTFVLQSFNVIDSYFQASVLAKKVVVVQTISLFVSSIIKLLFIFLKFDLQFFIYLYIFDAAFLSTGLLLIYKLSHHSIFAWHFDRNLARQFLRESWSLMFSSLFFLIYARIDQVMIKSMLNNHEVGIYSVAVKLSEFWVFIPSTIAASFMPAIINAQKTNQSVYENRYKKLYLLIFYLSLFISFIIFILAKPIVIILFGESYLGAIKPLQVYVWSGVASAVGYLVSMYLIIENHAKVTLVCAFTSMMINIILNWKLIPIFGISAAAFATLISYFFFIFGIAFFRKTRGHLVFILKALAFNG